MTFDPEKFLTAAVEMAVDQEEVNCRNAVSRAYYAAYHKARTAFPDAGKAPDDADLKVGMHKRFFTSLQQAPARSTERNVGLKLESLHKRRIVADYRLDDVVRPPDVAVVIDGAKILISWCSNAMEGTSNVPPSEVTCYADLDSSL